MSSPIHVPDPCIKHFEDGFDNVMAGVKTKQQARRDAKAQQQAKQEHFQMEGNLQTLRNNVVNANEATGIAMAATQSAIDVIMSIHNVSFKTAKHMIFENPNYQKYEEKLIAASINDDSVLSKKGLNTGAREIIER